MDFFGTLEGRIGIWGYGIVGKAIARLLIQHKKPIALFDTDRTRLSDNMLIGADLLLFSDTDELPVFFKSCSAIIPSPGIDLRPYEAYGNRYIAELDLFAQYWHKPIIGITGSVGKTSITTILGHLLNQNDMPTAVGGNIGIGSCDLLAQEPEVSGALLELSSFQLESTQVFKPDVAIISNLHANHLDRHGTMDAYWHAKAQIFARQTDHDLLITDWQLKERVRTLHPRSTVFYIGSEPLSTPDLLLPHEAYWYATDDGIVVVRKFGYQTYKKPECLFSATFAQNALIIYAAFSHLYHNDISQINFNCDSLSLPHRREHVGIYNDLVFINDSKATSTIAMLAAVNQYASKTTYLLMGGLSKGVDRTGIFSELPNSVQEVVCFGTEAEMLCHAAHKHTRNASAHANLQSALTHIMMHAQPGSVILLSPGGSSFDLYTNYEERGNHFKKLVQQLCAQKSCT